MRRNGSLGRKLALLALLAALPSCAHRAHWANQIGWEELEFAGLPDRADYPDAGAVVVLDEAEINVIRRGEINYSQVERHRIVKILDTRGLRYANTTIPYSPFTRVSHLQARTISPEGGIDVLDEEDVYDVTLYPDFVFYSDQRAKIFAVPAVDIGSVVEYRYRLTIENPTFWHSWVFQYDAPVLLSRFTLTVPIDWELDYRVYRSEVEAEEISVMGGTETTYRWEARDLPALKPEYGMPPRGETIARLAIAPVGIESWEDVSEWYRQLAEPQIEGGAGVQALADALTDGLTSDVAKLRAIYEWVRDRIRYVAVDIGIGGYQPHPAEEVLLNRYGDCKDMTTLLCSLARAAGLEAYEVIVSTWQNGRPDTTLPSPFQFNHMIAYSPVAAGPEGTWMDATEKGCPFGQLPWFDQGLPVLVTAGEDEAGIRVTPRAGPESNRVAMDWRVDLRPDGSATVQGETRLWGVEAADLREELTQASGEAQRQWLETYLAGCCSGATLEGYTISGLAPVADPLTISYTFRTRTFALARTRELTFRPGAILSSTLTDYLRSPEREHPIRFRYGLRRELDLALQLPAGYTLEVPAIPDSLVSAFGSAYRSWTTDGDVHRLRRSYYLPGDDIPPSEYGAFQEFLDNLRERDLSEVAVVRR
ncbi:DUF3857 domain-containing transglutaminase family protein [Candidatus Neomarinimicrobiota bacterium]